MGTLDNGMIRALGEMEQDGAGQSAISEWCAI